MFTPEELRQAKIFACLNETECARLAHTIADVRLEPGEWVFREGAPALFYVLLEGSLRIVLDVHGKQTEFPQYELKPGEFLGEVPLLLGTPTFGSLRAQTSCRIARLDKQQFHHLIRDSKEARTMILETLGERLLLIQQRSLSLPTSRVLIFGRNRNEDCLSIREFLSANRIPYEWVDRDVYPDRLPGGLSDDPDCPGVSVDGQLFSEPPTTRKIADALQLQTKPNHGSYDVVVVGAGPAGMAAGVYGSSEGLRVLIVERCAAGGQAGTSSRIENYLGFPEGISGEDLTGRGFKQATRFGAEVALTRSVEKITPSSEGYVCEFDGGQSVSARAVVLATGVDWRRRGQYGYRVHPSIPGYIAEGTAGWPAFEWPKPLQAWVPQVPRSASELTWAEMASFPSQLRKNPVQGVRAKSPGNRSRGTVSSLRLGGSSDQDDAHNEDPA